MKNTLQEMPPTGRSSRSGRETLEKAIGNPLYHWSHLELKRYFGYDGYLNGYTAEAVWNLCNEQLQSNGRRPRDLIKMSHVRLLCTTDDPVDTLEWHQKIEADPSFDVHVLPAWRPEKAMNIATGPDYLEYLEKLETVAGVEIDSFESLICALKIRMDFFKANGCRISDHSLDYVMYQPATEEEVEAIFAKRLAGKTITGQGEKAV